MSEEWAKATKEVAKTVGKGIDTSKNLGAFFAQFLTGSLKQAMGMIEDKLIQVRWKGQVRLQEKVEKYMKALGMDTPTRFIPPKFALPLIQAASLEDDDNIQDMWARLLVNGADERNGLDLQMAYIEILNNLTPLEAKILDKIYEIPFEESKNDGILTGDLPQRVVVAKQKANTERKEPTDEVKLAISNLIRLYCLKSPATLAGGEHLGNVNPTFLGKNFIEACKNRTR